MRHGKCHREKHPLMTHKLTLMRMKETSAFELRQLVDELPTLLAYEVPESFATKPIEIETPIGATTQAVLAQKNVVIMPILRAGLGMVNGMLPVIPNATIAHVGLERDDETLEIREYFRKFPKDIAEATLIITDPMLATGASAAHAIALAKEAGCQDIKLVNILAAPDGIAAIHRVHQEVPIYCAAIDEGLNEKGYIVPGLGDAGDRLFGTL
ncbi:uracil phosphoribosyltransferase [Eubacterium aggregans]|uniref:uracil phosphoribosyltransferase n=1 Tax=Eubacterium aggregans TaxID=81409 RepID=UPI003F3F06E1